MESIKIPVRFRAMPIKWDIGDQTVYLLPHRAEFVKCEKCTFVSFKTLKFEECGHLVCVDCASNRQTGNLPECPVCQNCSTFCEQTLDEYSLERQQMECATCCHFGCLDAMKAHLPCPGLPPVGHRAGITGKVLRRLAKRAGVKRISQAACDQAREALRGAATTLVRNAIAVRRSKQNTSTIRKSDAIYALSASERSAALKK